MGTISPKKHCGYKVVLIKRKLTLRSAEHQRKEEEGIIYLDLYVTKTIFQEQG
jgi:hypothetical protein